MISKPEYNSLFIAITKTASSSIRHRLLKLGTAPLVWTVPNYIDYKHPQHLNVQECKRILGEENFNNRFKYTIVKNPWHWLVSSYTSICRDHKNGILPKQGLHEPKIFQKWVATQALSKDYYDNLTCPRYGGACKHHRMTQESQLSSITDENGKIAVDFIGRYENVKADFQTILTKINEQHPLPTSKPSYWVLPVKNTSNRGHHYSYYYDDKTVESVREHCKVDIEEFGYEYEVE